MKEDNYNTVLELLDKYKKHILYVIVGILLLFSIIWLSVRQPQMPKEYKDAIDALNKANKELVERQKQLDSTIQVYENEVKQVDNQIDNIKEKTTIIKEYYHEQSVAGATPCSTKRSFNIVEVTKIPSTKVPTDFS